MKYPKLQDGEAIRINLQDTDLRFACCDCGKVHHWQFHHIKKKIYDFVFFSDARASGQLRRHKYGKLHKT